MKPEIKKEKKLRRHKRIRAKIQGTKKVPRLCVSQSNKHLYVQVIDDDSGKTLVSANNIKLGKVKPVEITEGEKKIELAGKMAAAFEVGKLIAKKSIESKIEKVVFDKGGYKYHGVVKALAQGARAGGLKF